MFCFPFQNKTSEAGTSDCFKLGTAMAFAIIVFIRHFLFRNKTAHLIANALEFMYTPWPDKSNKYALRSQLVDLLGDYLFFAPSHEVADVQSQVAPVYMYEFAQRAKTSMGADWMGVVHSENVPFDFGVPLIPMFFPFYSQADRNVSLFIITMYANFAGPAILQSAVSRGRNTTRLTELTLKWTQVPS